MLNKKSVLKMALMFVVSVAGLTACDIESLNKAGAQINLDVNLEEKVDVDFSAFKHSLCIIDVHASHADLTPDYVIIYFIDGDVEQEAFVQEITIDAMGQLSTWPEGVFSEGFDLLAKIMQHREV